jgi:hypothetical protein
MNLSDDELDGTDSPLPEEEAEEEAEPSVCSPERRTNWQSDRLSEAGLILCIPIRGIQPVFGKGCELPCIPM